MKKILFLLAIVFSNLIFSQGNSFKTLPTFLEADEKYNQSDLYWAYNTLMSAEENAFIFTSSKKEYDLLQYVAAQKMSAINVMRIEFVTDEKSLDLSIKELLSSKNRLVNDALLDTLNFFNSKNNIYCTLTLNNKINDEIKHKSYVTGLAIKLSDQPFDNLSVLKNNVEQKFLLDYLKVSFEEENSNSISKSVYLVPFSMLYRAYKSEKSENKANVIKDFLTKIASQTGNDAMLPTLLGEQTTNTFSSTLLPKNLEKGMVQVNGNLYASEVETTNEQYNAFLQDLLANKEFDKINICRSEKVEWRNLLPKEYKDSNDAAIFPYGNQDQNRFPVVNISFDAVKIYCNWLTDAYNSSISSKKKYKKVVFRLGTEQEWENAARGKKVAVTYPNGNDYKNAKGCFLNNYYLYAEKYICTKCFLDGHAKDGAHFTVWADAYYPNDIGLFNMSGNVAEMISEKGKAKGGSWEDIPENCTIQSIKTYEKPSPAVGFRVFMEILE